MIVPQYKAPVTLEDHLQGSRQASVQLVLCGDYDGERRTQRCGGHPTFYVNGVRHDGPLAIVPPWGSGSAGLDAARAEFAQT